MFLKNVGNASATNVVPTFALHIVPERPVGIPAFDRIPSGDCADRALGRQPGGPILDEQEVSLELPQPGVALPPLLNGEPVRLYGVGCVSYSDASGSDHTVCDTYRYKPVEGAAVFMCDATPIRGKFDSSSISNCAN